MINNIKFSLLVSGSLFFIWWFFLADMQTDRTAAFYTRSEFAEDAGTIYFDMGRLSLSRNDYAAAINSFKKAIHINDVMFSAYDLLGLTYEKMADVENALKTYALAMHINPYFLYFRSDPEKLATHPPQDQNLELMSDIKPWHGESLQGKSIYVHCSLGIGETIQYLRFLKRISTHAQHIFFKPQRELLELLRNNPIPHVTLVDITTNINELACSYYTALESLPYILDVSSTQLAELSEQPYLEPIKSYTAQARSLTALATKAIGIFWQQSPHCLEKITLAELYQLTNSSQVTLYSFNTLTRDEQHFLSQQSGHALIMLSEYTRTLALCASLLNAMDIVISTDSWVAHMAAAMGKRVYLLVDTQAHWSWFSECEAPAQRNHLLMSPSIWYPTLTKVHRQKNHSWKEVIQALSTHITANKRRHLS